MLAKLSAVATMERNCMTERTQADLAIAKSEVKRIGRPCKTSYAQRIEIRDLQARGKSVSDVALNYKKSRPNVIISVCCHKKVVVSCS
jgi:DNA invertase Pin-like site-specific DNA recombinase